MAEVLIVDDDGHFCKMLARAVERAGHTVDTAETREAGVTKVQQGHFDVVYLDVQLPDGNGLDAIPRIRNATSAPEVIIITGAGSAEGAELAITSGAWDYIGKGASRQEMILPLVRAVQYRDGRTATTARIFDRGPIIGASPAITHCLEAAADAANSDANVLITGETGTGKELFAKAIHNNSRRRAENCVVVDCAALPDSLVESILFGHVRGAFTGADRDRDGLIQQADSGTLFLDEVGELPMALQKAFLRVLEDHRYRPIGSQKQLRSDFRLIAATNRDLDAMVEEGGFRDDLRFRLRVLTIHIPPLRDRKEDIKLIAFDHINRLCERHGMATKGFSPDLIAALDSYDWPGNVRELCHTLDRVFVAAGKDPVLFPKHLPTGLRVHMIKQNVADIASQTNGEAAPDCKSGSGFLPLRTVREQAIARAERHYLNELLDATGFDISEACTAAGVSTSRMYEMMKKYGIVRS